MKTKKFRMSLLLAMMCPVAGALALLSILFVDSDKNNVHRVLSYVIAAVFWLSLILTQLFLWIANAERKSVERKLKKKLSDKNSRPGIISFFSSKEAKIADAVMLISAAIVAFLAIKGISIGWMVLSAISMFFLSLNMHSFLNGRNYKALKAYKNLAKERNKHE